MRLLWSAIQGLVWDSTRLFSRLPQSSPVMALGISSERKSLGLSMIVGAVGNLSLSMAVLSFSVNGFESR